MRVVSEDGSIFRELKTLDRVKYSLSAIGRALRERNMSYSSNNEDEPPTYNSPLIIPATCEESERLYLWTAAVIFGRESNIKFNADAILYDGDSTVLAKQLGEHSGFSKESIYYRFFRGAYSREMLIIPSRGKIMAILELERELTGVVSEIKISSPPDMAPAIKLEKNTSQREISKKASDQAQAYEIRRRLEDARREELLKTQSNQRKESENARNREASKPLFALCANRQERARISEVNLCLINGANVNATDDEGNSALIIALDCQNEHIAEFLLRKGANPCFRNRNQLTALDFVSTGSSLFSLIQEKIKEQALLDETDQPRVVRLSKQLHEEICNFAPKARKIKSLLTEGAQIDYQSPEDGYTALMLAVDAQNDRIVEYLLNQGANPLIRNNNGEIARDLSSVHSQIYSLLQQKEVSVVAAKLPPDTANSMLLQEYINGPEVSIQKIDEFLEAGAVVDYQNEKGFTCLMIMVNKGNDTIAEYLLKVGANPLLRSKADKIPSDYASQSSGIYSLLKGYELLFSTARGDFSAIEKIINENESLIHFKGRGGYNGLLIAIERGFHGIAKYYLDLGADLFVIQDDGSGVFDLAADDEMCALIKQYQDLRLSHENLPDGAGEEFSQAVGDVKTMNTMNK